MFTNQMFGYNKEQVKEVIDQLNDEILGLRQQTFESEKQTTETPAGENSTDNSANIQLSAELKESRNLINKRNNEINELYNKCSELEGMLQNTTIPNSEQPAKKPNYDIIEKIYERAFESSSYIISDARDSIEKLTNNVYNELDHNLTKVNEFHMTFADSKTHITELVDQISTHLKAIENLTVKFEDEHERLVDFSATVKQSKEDILKKLSEDVKIFQENAHDIAGLTAVEDYKTVSEEKQADIIEEAVSSEPVYEAEPEQEEKAESMIFTSDNNTDSIEAALSAEEDEEELEQPIFTAAPAEEDEDEADAGINPEALDSDFTLEALMVDMKQDITSDNSKKFKSSEEVKSEELIPDEVEDTTENLKRMHESIKKEFEMKNNIVPEQEAADNFISEELAADSATEETKTKSSKPKVNINDILRKYAN